MIDRARKEWAVCESTHLYFLFAALGIVLFPAEHQQLADKIVCNDHKNRRDQLDGICVDVQPIVEDEEHPLLEQQRHHASARKGDELTHDGEKAALFAFKYPDAVGDEGKQHCRRPRNHVCRVHEEYRFLDRLSPKVIKEKADAPIDHRRQSSKDQIQDLLPKARQQRFDFFDHVF